jgi:hypothetical protein
MEDQLKARKTQFPLEILFHKKFKIQYTIDGLVDVAIGDNLLMKKGKTYK